MDNLGTLKTEYRPPDLYLSPFQNIQKNGTFPEPPVYHFDLLPKEEWCCDRATD